jgi:predicted TIM-barrel fold metal-dependent hydrolase
MLHDGGVAAGENLVFQNGDAAGMIEIARRFGTEKTAIMSWAAPLSLDTDAGNGIVANAVRQFPDELVGLSTVHPEYDSAEKIDAIIAHYHEELKFPGLKTFTPLQTIDYDDPLYDRWLSYGDTHHLYLVLDPKGGSGATACVRNLATRYPNLGLHVDHCGRSWEYAKWAVKMAQEFPSVWLQLNFTAATNGTIEWIVEQVGAHRVLYGTDAPMRDPRPQAAWLTWTRLPESDKRKIFGENFAAILAATYPSTL